VTVDEKPTQKENSPTSNPTSTVNWAEKISAEAAFTNAMEFAFQENFGTSVKQIPNEKRQEKVVFAFVQRMREKHDLSTVANFVQYSGWKKDVCSEILDRMTEAGRLMKRTTKIQGKDVIHYEEKIKRVGLHTEQDRLYIEGALAEKHFKDVHDAFLRSQVEKDKAEMAIRARAKKNIDDFMDSFEKK